MKDKSDPTRMLFMCAIKNMWDCYFHGKHKICQK